MSTESLYQIVAALTSPNEYIPTFKEAGIDGEELRRAVACFRQVVFAGYFGVSEPDSSRSTTDRAVDLSASTFSALEELATILTRQISRACRLFRNKCNTLQSQEPADPVRITEQMLAVIPELRRQLGTDVKAVFDGDPAAESYEEVILCYPAIVAMTHYRMAHALLRLGVPILPRLITEQAHSITGIDIHPGAVIGDYFSIDHGTGVVIGETCIIGEHVRIYQGVTLGAKSFKFDAAGNILQEPRHPILEDRVVVYSNASILGRIRIGHDSIIGGNIWQTTDLPPYSRVVQGQASVSPFEHGSGI